MSPKEKAEELFEKHKMFSWGIISEVKKENTKANSLITISEILSDIPYYLQGVNPKRFYWEQVKQEIENL